MVRTFVLFLIILSSNTVLHSYYPVFERKIFVKDEMIVRNREFNVSINNDGILYGSAVPNENCKLPLTIMADSLIKDFEVQIPEDLLRYPDRCRTYLLDYILINKDSIIVQIAEYLLIYTLENNHYNLKKSLNLEKLFQKNILYYSSNILMINNKIFGWDNSYRSKMDMKKNFFYWWINLEDTSDYGFSNFQYPKDYYWTVAIPRDGFDINDECYFVSRFTDYKITFYNFDGEPVDSIRRDEPKWNKFESIPDSTVLTSHPVNVFNFLKREGDEKFLIHRTNFIGDDKILVCYSHGKAEDKMYNEYYDIWQKENGKWNLKVKDLNFNETQVSDNPYENKPFGRNYRICDDKIISFHLDFESDSGSYVLIRKFDE